MSEKALELVKKLFLAVAQKEEAIEEQRQALSEMDNFEVGACFKKLDKDRKGYVTKADISSLLTSNGIKDAPEQSISNMIRYFDSMESDKLKMNDFSQILLPWSNDYLRNRAANRRLNHEIDPFTKEVQKQLSSLLQKECGYHTEIESIKKEISEAENSDPQEIFKAIDKKQYGFLDSCVVEDFLRSQGYEAPKEDVQSVIRRFDVIADARISYWEFAEGITPADKSVKGSEEYSRSLGGVLPYNNLRSNMAQNNFSQEMGGPDRREFGVDYQPMSPYQLSSYPNPTGDEGYYRMSNQMGYPQNDMLRQSHPNAITGSSSAPGSGLENESKFCTGPLETEVNDGYFQKQRLDTGVGDERYRLGNYRRRLPESGRPSPGQRNNPNDYQGLNPDLAGSSPFGPDQRFNDEGRNDPTRNSYPAYFDNRNSENQFQAPVRPFGNQMQDQKYESPTRYNSDKYNDYQFGSSNEISRPDGGNFGFERSLGYEGRSKFMSSFPNQSMGNNGNIPYSPPRSKYSKHDRMSSQERFQVAPTIDHKRSEYPIYPGGYSNMGSSVPQNNRHDSRNYFTPNRKYRDRNVGERSNSRYSCHRPKYLSNSPQRYNFDTAGRKNEYSEARKSREFSTYKNYGPTPSRGTYSRQRSRYSHSEARRPRSDYGRGSLTRTMPTSGSGYHGKYTSPDYSRPTYTAYGQRPSYGAQPRLPTRGVGPIAVPNPGHPFSTAKRSSTPPKSAAVANPNESAEKAHIGTPAKPVSGAFNMAVGPETAAKTGDGWSFVPSPDLAKKEGKAKEIEKDSKSPIRI